MSLALDHSVVLLLGPAGVGAERTVSYPSEHETIHTKSSPKVHAFGSSTTFACSARPLAQLFLSAVPTEQSSSVTARYIEPRSRAPAGVLTDIARRSGLVAAARAYDAGMSAPVLRS